MQQHRLNQTYMDKTLDEILSYLKTIIFIEDQNYIQYLNSVDIFFFCYGENLADVNNYTEPNLFLERLHRDGFVNYRSNENDYQINLVGIEFINNGGYQKLRKTQQVKNYVEIVKIIAITLNAIILLFFAYFTFKNDKIQIEKNNLIQTKNKS